jgi:hypothetical protein
VIELRAWKGNLLNIFSSSARIYAEVREESKRKMKAIQTPIKGSGWLSKNVQVREN